MTNNAINVRVSNIKGEIEIRLRETKPTPLKQHLIMER